MLKCDDDEDEIDVDVIDFHCGGRRSGVLASGVATELVLELVRNALPLSLTSG
ncbi:hypothetical protein ACLOJK_037610 [Asimina triloba]